MNFFVVVFFPVVSNLFVVIFNAILDIKKIQYNLL